MHVFCVYWIFFFTCLCLRHRYRYLYSSPRVCCSIHSDAKLKDPFSLAQKDLQDLYEDIKKVQQKYCIVCHSILPLNIVFLVHSVVLHSVIINARTLSITSPMRCFMLFYFRYKALKLTFSNFCFSSCLSLKRSWKLCVIITLMGREKPFDQWLWSWWLELVTSTAIKRGEKALQCCVCVFIHNAMHQSVLIRLIWCSQDFAAGPALNRYDLWDDPHCQPGARWRYWWLGHKTWEKHH